MSIICIKSFVKTTFMIFSTCMSDFVFMCISTVSLFSVVCMLHTQHIVPKNAIDSRLEYESTSILNRHQRTEGEDKETYMEIDRTWINREAPGSNSTEGSKGEYTVDNRRQDMEKQRGP